MSKDYGAAVSQKGYDVKSCDDRFLVYSSAFQNLKILSTQAVSATVPADVGVGFQSFTAATNDIITSTAHGLVNGNKVSIALINTGCGGLNEHDIYYVVQKTTDTFKLSNTLGGSAIDITSSGDGYWQTAPNRITVTHNLGYISPFFVVFTGSTNMGRNFCSLFSYFGNSTFGYNCRQYTNKIEIDIFSGDGTAGDIFYFSIVQFLDDFSTIDPRSINTGTTIGASSNDYGIRVSIDGYDVKTCTDDQCAFSSSFFSQIIHMKGSTTADSLAHGLGYVPNFIAYMKSSDIVGDYVYYDNFITSADATYIYPYANGETTYYIIFKDKLNG